MLNLHFYPPVSDGAFIDLIEGLRHAGASCSLERPSFARCIWQGVRFNVVHDVEEGGVRAQITDDAGLGPHAWDQIDAFLTHATSRDPGARLMRAGFNGPIGMSYDSWWETLGAPAGIPYEPEESERRRLAMNAKYAVGYWPDEWYAAPMEYGYGWHGYW
jgi:hypothetical protein